MSFPLEGGAGGVSVSWLHSSTSNVSEGAFEQGREAPAFSQPERACEREAGRSWKRAQMLSNPCKGR